VVSWNRAAEAILGYRKEEVLGQKVEVLFPEDVYPDLEASFARLPSQGVIRALSTWMQGTKGHRVGVELTLSALSKGGETPGVICIARDVSEWKRARDLFHSGKLASIGRLPARAAQEILNPLHIIGLQVQMAERVKRLPRKVLEMLNVVRQQVERISRFTANLRRFSRESPPSRATFDLRRLILETLSLVEDELRLAQIEVALDLAPLPLEITGDREQLAQVLLNLISNAKEAMAQGGKLTVRAAPSQKGRAEWVNLRVEDTGCGIPPEHLGKVFDPFFTTKPEGRGMGLGLAVCFGIVESHGGTISIESEPRRGTTFTIELPKKPGSKS
jgi:PAS domain S-box-containing protein